MMKKIMGRSHPDAGFGMTSDITGLTLIEMIIAILLVSIVVLGLFSVSSILLDSSQDYGKRYVLASQTQATLNNILNQAALAVGTGIQQDNGIMISNFGSRVGLNTMCIHKVPQGSQQAYYNRAGGYWVYGPSTTWACYTWFPGSHGTYPYQIMSCSFNYLSGPSPNGADNCDSQLAQNQQYVGSAFSIFPVFSNGVFSMTINNCYNNAASSCQASGFSGDRFNNPEIVKTGSVATLQNRQQ